MYLNFKIDILVLIDCYYFDQIFLRPKYKEAYVDFLHCYSVKVFIFHANIPKLSEPVNSS
jgi:hypothetical protein